MIVFFICVVQIISNPDNIYKLLGPNPTVSFPMGHNSLIHQRKNPREKSPIAGNKSFFSYTSFTNEILIIARFPPNHFNKYRIKDNKQINNCMLVLKDCIESIFNLTFSFSFFLKMLIQ